VEDPGGAKQGQDDQTDPIIRWGSLRAAAILLEEMVFVVEIHAASRLQRVA
jgi:hypothetical protein